MKIQQLKFLLALLLGLSASINAGALVSQADNSDICIAAYQILDNEEAINGSDTDIDDLGPAPRSLAKPQQRLSTTPESLNERPTSNIAPFTHIRAPPLS